MGESISAEYMNTIVKADCMDVLRNLPDNAVDAIITDPPYCSGGRGISDRQKTTQKKYADGRKTRPDFFGDSKDVRSWSHWCITWISEGYRALKQGGYFLMFSDWRQLPTATDVMQIGGISWKGLVVWNKGLGSRAPHKGYFRHQFEYILWGTKGACINKNNKILPGCYEYHIRQSDKFHIAGKPTPLMEDLVEIVPSRSIILDPFAGSGTTCIAAMNKGRNFIGVEFQQEYYDIACKRIKDARAAKKA